MDDWQRLFSYFFLMTRRNRIAKKNCILRCPYLRSFKIHVAKVIKVENGIRTRVTKSEPLRLAILFNIYNVMVSASQ